MKTTMIKILLFLVAVSFFAMPVCAGAQEPPQGLAPQSPAPQNPTPPGTEDKFVKQTYSYTAKNLRDPFFSIIEAARMQKEAERKRKKEKGVFAPLEDYALSQVRLIAIVWDKEGRHYALVGLPDNKYYTIEEGMNIGLHGGRVSTITENSVVIREMLPDYKGIIKPEDTIIRLREEEGE